MGGHTQPDERVTHTTEYDGETVTMSDGSERPRLGPRDWTVDENPERSPLEDRLAAIEVFLIETREIADRAAAEVKDETTVETIQHRVSNLEDAVWGADE